MKYIKITCLIALLISASGCKKWLDVNSDPATPQNVAAEFYLAPMIARMAVTVATDYSNAHFKYIQNVGAQVASDPMERHSFYSTDNAGGVLWRFVYVDAGKNLEEIITKSQAQNNNTLLGVAYAIKAWGYQMTTDSHGPIILNDALKDQLTFTYQDQPEVYEKVREWCYLALAKLNTPDGLVNPALLRTNDYLFGSTIPANNSLTAYRDRWKKFVYAILATQYSHLTNKPEFTTKYADSVVKFVDLSFGSTTFNSSEDPAINFEGVNAANANPLSVTGNSLNAVASAAAVANVGSGRVGQPVISYMTGGMRGTPVTNPTTLSVGLDPRLSRMVSPSATVIQVPTVPATTPVPTAPVYKGVIATRGDTPTAKTVPHAYGSVAAPYPGKYIFGQGLTDGQKSRLPLYSYAQLQFAKAEALFLKGNTGAAWTAYDRGIRGHMDFVNTYGRSGLTTAPAITAAEITAYMASSEVAQNSTTLTLADIMGQKYIAQWGWAGQEQWCDLRKWHYRADVFRQFKQLDQAEFSATLNGVGLYAYRLRPRFNSEYVWNRPELEKWGGLSPTYSYKETWFSLPTN